MTSVKGDGCVMMGVTKDDDGYYVTRSYDGPPKIFVPNDIDKFEKYCGYLNHYRTPNTNEFKVCCDQEQFDAFAAQIVTLGLFVGSCPACFQNILKSQCELMCNPDQKKFIRVTKFNTTKNGYNLNIFTFS